MKSLPEYIAELDTLTGHPMVGDRVLFARPDDSGSFSINLGEVKKLRPGSEFEEATVLVRGIHAFYPDGTSKRFRGSSLSLHSFPVSYFARSVTERLLEHAKRWETRAADARRWVSSLHP